MIRRVIGATLIAVMSIAPLAADEGRRQTTTGSAHSSGAKRAMWIAIGAAAGFGAGLFIGLDKFDDAIDSDRKVWTTALVAAAAGGVAGGLLSRNIGRSTPTGRPDVQKNPASLGVSWESALRGSTSGLDTSSRSSSRKP